MSIVQIIVTAVFALLGIAVVIAGLLVKALRDEQRRIDDICRKGQRP